MFSSAVTVFGPRGTCNTIPQTPTPDPRFLFTLAKDTHMQRRFSVPVLLALAAMSLNAGAQAPTTKAASAKAAPTDYSAPPGAPYTAENVTVSTPEGHTLAGTLTLPEGASKEHPVGAVVTITGTGPQDRDEYIGLEGYRPFRQLADSLGRRGVAVLRMDDRGVGQSKGTFKGTTDEGFAADIEAGLAYLRTRPEIDSHRLGLIGHSEGAVTAPIVAEHEPDLCAIVLMAGVARSLSETLAYQDGNSILSSTKLTTAQKDSALAAVPKEIDSLVNKSGDPWWKFLLTHDFGADQRKVKTPSVLIVTGANDQQADSHQVSEMAMNFALAGNRDVTGEIIPGVDHLFVRDADGFPGNYARLPKPVHMERAVVGVVVDWVAKRLGPST